MTCNPLNDGRRRYEWQAGRQLKKVYVKADLKEGTKPGVDEQTGTVLKIVWSNGNLLEGEVTSAQASATVTRCGVDVTEEYAASAFAWKRDSGNAEADATWNATHAGMKSITCTATDLNGNVKISCTLTASSASYGSITVDDDLDASHTPGELDANDIFVIEDGYLKVTTSRGNAYVLENGVLKAAGAKLNGSITAESKLFASQPEDIVEFSYDHNGLRTQKKVTKADGTVETTDYMLHGKLLTHLTRGSDIMHFFYDAQARPAMVEFNGALYSYIHNLQGDIVGIVDSSGSFVVEYKYDAWGKPVVVRTLTNAYEALAELNPFRYRGYAHDEETGLYYLQNRYYDCALSKFVNADIDLGARNLFDHNQYAYCKNLPIAFYDPDGKGGILSNLAWFFMDWFGQMLWDHWCAGLGTDLVIENVPPVDEYLWENENFQNDVKGIVLQALNARRVEEGSGRFSETGSIDLSGGTGGDYFTGYGMINGTNDFTLTGTISNTSEDNVYHVEAEYVLRDRMDANGSYARENFYWWLFKIDNLGLAFDYNLEIRGTLEFDVYWLP